MAFDEFEDFVLPLVKSLGLYDIVHREGNEPTLDELSWLPFWELDARKTRLITLYEKAHGKPLRPGILQKLKVLTPGPPRRIG